MPETNVSSSVVLTPFVRSSPARSRVERVFLVTSAGRRAQEIAAEARAAGVPVSSIDEAECDRLCGARAQGIAAATHFTYADHEDVLDAASGDSLVVYLDGVTDPHNLGAVLRTAAAAGVAGVVLPGRRSVGRHRRRRASFGRRCLLRAGGAGR